MQPTSKLVSAISIQPLIFSLFLAKNQLYLAQLFIFKSLALKIHHNQHQPTCSKNNQRQIQHHLNYSFSKPSFASFAPSCTYSSVHLIHRVPSSSLFVDSNILTIVLVPLIYMHFQLVLATTFAFLPPIISPILFIVAKITPHKSCA